MLEDAALAPAACSARSSRAGMGEPGWSRAAADSAAERHQVIRDARAAWAGAARAQPELAAVRGEAAHWLAMPTLKGCEQRDTSGDFEARGLGRLRYLEIVGALLARLANVDFYVRGLGATELPLPEPSTAAPNRP